MLRLIIFKIAHIRPLMSCSAANSNGIANACSFTYQVKTSTGASLIVANNARSTLLRRTHYRHTADRM